MALQTKIVARKWLSDHVIIPADTNATIEELLDSVFSMRSAQTLYNEEQSVMEAGSKTSTVTLRVVGGDEKGSLKSETVKYGHESQGNRSQGRLRWRGQAAYTKYRPVLSSEMASHKNKTLALKE
jgi:hypothetical protein